MVPLESRTGLVARFRHGRLGSRTAVLGAGGAVAGVLCGLLGVAGGVVIVPVLTSRRVGMARAEASGTTIAAVLPISVVAAVTYAGLHNVDHRAASAIVPGAAAGVVIGSLLASRVRAPVLRGLFNVVLLATAVRLLVALPRGSVHQIAVEVPALLTLCALGTFAGLASGMLGSGGGTFLVPALVLGFGLAQQVAQGTALLALIPIWVIGALTHHKTRTLRLREAATVGSCGALTVPIGAEIASHIGPLPLRVIFAAFLIATVTRSLLHPQPQKPAAAVGGRPETGSQSGAGTHVQAAPRPEQPDRMRPAPGLPCASVPLDNQASTALTQQCPAIAAQPPRTDPGPRGRLRLRVERPSARSAPERRRPSRTSHARPSPLTAPMTASSSCRRPDGPRSGHDDNSSSRLTHAPNSAGRNRTGHSAHAHDRDICGSQPRRVGDLLITERCLARPSDAGPRYRCHRRRLRGVSADSQPGYRCCAGILLGTIRGKGPLRPGLAPRQGEDILSSYMPPTYTCASSTASAGPPRTFQRWLEAMMAWRLLGTG
jgi:uncharacterized protein